MVALGFLCERGRQRRWWLLCLVAAVGLPRGRTLVEREGERVMGGGDREGGGGSLLDFMWERGRRRRRSERDGRGRRRELSGFRWGGERERAADFWEEEREDGRAAELRRWRGGRHRSWGRWKGRRWQLSGDDEKEAVAVLLGDGRGRRWRWRPFCEVDERRTVVAGVVQGKEREAVAVGGEERK